MISVKMGRYYFDKKDTVESSLKLDIRKLKEWNYLNCVSFGSITWTSGWEEKKDSISFRIDTLDENPFIRLIYTITNQETGMKEEFDYKINMDWTKCNYGGKRWWFLCPLVKNGHYCGRRTGTLLKPDGTKYFGCRHCYKLTYNSRNENRKGRLGYLGRMFDLDEKAEKLHKKIKRFTYAGKLTKKYQRYINLQDRTNFSAIMSLENELNK